MFVLPPPSPPFTSATTIAARSRHHQHHPLAISATASVSDHLTSSRRYDFSPLLDFLSTQSSPPPPPDASPPSHLDPAELRLAESYRAVPAPL
ncbi:hypothetical protein J5N97_011643 [Dioscorea zingiberensis]|uniref:Uncharacterized protein n=1 Tax=Dioscorea zingiberensis TaxID=325984 RepID=A0A9D5HNT8_9LILI|nr:hypothetical protein J5N97_011643 [Dioscorea zingiberensis]